MIAYRPIGLKAFHDMSTTPATTLRLQRSPPQNLGVAIPNRNRNLKTSKALLKSQAHQGTSLFTSAATKQRGSKGGTVKRSSGPISRIPGGDKIAFKVGAVQVEKVNDQMGQGRSV